MKMNAVSNNYTCKRVNYGFPDDVRIRRVHEIYEIKNLMARHLYNESFCNYARDLDENWVGSVINRATASYGMNDGYSVGFHNLRDNLVTRRELWQKKNLEILAKAEPGVQVCDENLGMGTMQLKCATVPLIEIAKDGETALGMWYCNGILSYYNGDEAFTRWIYCRYAVDFIKEDGVWKIWHMFVGTDYTPIPGEDFGKNAFSNPAWLMLHDGDADTDFVYNIPMKDAYTFRYNYSDYPKTPEPYDSFDPSLGCGPESNPKYN